MAISRRNFIRAGAGALAVGLSTSHGFAASTSTAKAARALVIIELNGGNDGLNTVIPYADPAYHQARPTLAIPPSQVLKLSGDTGLHPSMPEMAELFHNGKLAIFRGVGCPSPSRSHFASQQTWHTADPSGAGTTGWLAGRSPLYYCGPVCPQMFCGVAATPVCLDAAAAADLIRRP
ncbi:MAG: twin-arginine translocation pathway signal protein, partial [Tepidisphaeraceae bacterium]